MLIKDFFKQEDRSLYTVEFVHENETVFIIKRNEFNVVDTAKFRYKSVSIFGKQMLLILKENTSEECKTLHLSLIPFNSWMLISDPVDTVENSIDEKSNSSCFKDLAQTFMLLGMGMKYFNPGASDPTNPENKKQPL